MSEEATPGGGHRASSWSSGTMWPVSQIALGIGAVVVGVTDQDPLALLLTGVLALFLIPAGALQLLRRPRIEVVDGQLAIKKLGGVIFVSPAELVEVRALGVARWGARQHLMRLEYIDDRGREQLDVFTRGDLGTDPREVVETLAGLGFTGSGSRAHGG
ncbi:PH domain-containing protein [Rhodococcus sp. IEGM 1408]|uniref:PH domain-containing protein n=1 Tax=Rhodococcus sp. IEGM 1408 TaxID=3082220 RepID=UPI002954D3C4|nr:PH domain-containing protein [Rhodococcus sp. IEGM 1408]MDV8000133.1 PH domain-containing protein [Rhodococcus sp. IEGM 1408]